MAFAILGCLASASITSAFGQEPGKQFRKLAPGVERTIPFEHEINETFSTHDVVEIRANQALKWKPNFEPESRTLFEMAKDVKFRRPVTGLDISFKPLRMMTIDVPQPSGKFQKKLVWYLVYRVTNRGAHMEPVKNEDGTWAAKAAPEREVYFVPHFSLYSHEHEKEYLDQIIPVALGPIQKREDPNRPLLNTVQISAKPIPLSTDRVDRSVWGVVTWDNVDPTIDFLSIYVQGLTNSYRWKDTPGAYKPGDPLGKGRKFTRRTLQLNFWRPGDEFEETEDEIRFGTKPGSAKVYGVQEGVDYTWLYR